MIRLYVKSIAAAGAAVGLMISTAGLAFPAGKPTGTARTPLKPVIFIDQARIDAQGLTPRAALQRASRFLKFQVSTPHFIPKGYRLILVHVYPLIQYGNPPGDTQTFEMLSVRPARSFEVDHQLGQPFVYQSPFVVTAAKLGRRAVTVAEEKVTDSRTHRGIDQLMVYWYDARSKVATEVTAELRSSGLSRAAILQIAASVS